MEKIREIIIGTNNDGKYREICDLLPKKIKKYSPKTYKILTPKETGKSFEENSILKASYFAKKTNLVCLSPFYQKIVREPEALITLIWTKN